VENIKWNKLTDIVMYYAVEEF